jgi:crossover junction endodeoxyribonuclease RuvC
MSGRGRESRRILGIDPGSRITGYAVIDSDGQRSQHRASGCIRIGAEPWPDRLGNLFRAVSAVVEQYAPADLAVEQVFFARDPSAALKLGQARGAILCAALQAGVAVYEYSARAVKLAVVGTGGADKAQVQHMVRVLLALAEEPAEDEADALAAAICHAHSLGALGGRGAIASWRDWSP